MHQNLWCVRIYTFLINVLLCKYNFQSYLLINSGWRVRLAPKISKIKTKKKNILLLEIIVKVQVTTGEFWSKIFWATYLKICHWRFPDLPSIKMIFGDLKRHLLYKTRQQEGMQNPLFQKESRLLTFKKWFTGLDMKEFLNL